MKPMLLLVGAVIILSLGFLGGTMYQKTQQSVGQNKRFTNAQPSDGQFNNQRMQTGQGPINGNIVSRDDSTVTIKTPDGSTKIVVYSQDTTVNKTSSAAITDLKEGENIVVVGTSNTDGTITAQIISIGGQIMGGNRPGEQKQQ